MNISEVLKGRSLREYYLLVCKDLQITPNSLFTSMLPTEPNQSLQVEELDFTRNYVGDRGMIAVVKVIELCPNLKVVKLRDNGLRNKAVEAICDSLKKYPGNLQILDLSKNYISNGAGKQLESLLKENLIIKEINIDGTKIDYDIRLRIKEVLEKR